jgi:BCCT family betaine/carnitine transporter
MVKNVSVKLATAKKTSEESSQQVGLSKSKLLEKTAYNAVFFPAVALIILLSLLTLMAPDRASDVLRTLRADMLSSFDWLFAITPPIIFIFCVGLAISPFGTIRLGGTKAIPEHSRISWISMLFAAGVGIGFMFWGAAEPLAYHSGVYGTPLNAPVGSADANRLAFSATLFHWGLSPWAIYGLIGLALGFFAYNRNLPLTIRSVFYPILGDRIYGWPGHMIDLLAVVCSIFGLATTIGLGSIQAATGLGYLFGFEAGIGTQIALIAAMVALAAISVLRGINGGIKLLSNINMGLATLLLLFVIIAGPTILIVTGLGRNSIAYLADMAALTNWIDRSDPAWFHDWTIFYWAWWVAWSPFVGMFIAQISRGRTVREYMFFVLMVPFVICLLWFTALGETAIFQFDNGIGGLASGIDDVSLVLFQMLQELPLASITVIGAIILLIIFIVTSADSGSHVIGTIAAGGNQKASSGERLLWAAIFGLTAAALLYGGGAKALQTLQSGTIVAALPFTVILMVCCLSLYLGMRDEYRELNAAEGDE